MMTRRAAESPQTEPPSLKPHRRLGGVYWIGAIVCFVMLAFVFVELIDVALVDGTYPLSVTVQSKSAVPVVGVSYCVFPRADIGEHFLDDPLLEPDLVPVDSFTGQPFIVKVRFSCKSSWLGRRWDYVQEKGLLLLLEFQNGEKRYEMVEIPRLNESRSVAVTVPGHRDEVPRSGQKAEPSVLPLDAP